MSCIYFGHKVFGHKTFTQHQCETGHLLNACKSRVDTHILDMHRGSSKDSSFGFKLYSVYLPLEWNKTKQTTVVDFLLISHVSLC